jgi:hypothetical protein
MDFEPHNFSAIVASVIRADPALVEPLKNIFAAYARNEDFEEGLALIDGKFHPPLRLILEDLNEIDDPTSLDQEIQVLQLAIEMALMNVEEVAPSGTSKPKKKSKAAKSSGKPKKKKKAGKAAVVKKPAKPSKKKAGKKKTVAKAGKTVKKQKKSVKKAGKTAVKKKLKAGPKAKSKKKSSVKKKRPSKKKSVPRKKAVNKKK